MTRTCPAVSTRRHIAVAALSAGAVVAALLAAPPDPGPIRTDTHQVQFFDVVFAAETVALPSADLDDPPATSPAPASAAVDVGVVLMGIVFAPFVFAIFALVWVISQVQGLLSNLGLRPAASTDTKISPAEVREQPLSAAEATVAVQSPARPAAAARHTRRGASAPTPAPTPARAAEAQIVGAAETASPSTAAHHTKSRVTRGSAVTARSAESAPSRR